MSSLEADFSSDTRGCYYQERRSASSCHWCTGLFSPYSWRTSYPFFDNEPSSSSLQSHLASIMDCLKLVVILAQILTFSLGKSLEKEIPLTFLFVGAEPTAKKTKAVCLQVKVSLTRVFYSRSMWSNLHLDFGLCFQKWHLCCSYILESFAACQTMYIHIHRAGKRTCVGRFRRLRSARHTTWVLPWILGLVHRSQETWRSKPHRDTFWWQILRQNSTKVANITLQLTFFCLPFGQSQHNRIQVFGDIPVHSRR